MENWSPVLMLVLKRRIMVLVSSVTWQVTSTHAGVKEENNGVGKYCYM